MTTRRNSSRWSRIETAQAPPPVRSGEARGSLRLLRLRVKFATGKLLNAIKIPGIVRDCDYSSSSPDARVSVKREELFTVISVGDLDVYFNRFTGEIDGVGRRPKGCTPD